MPGENPLPQLRRIRDQIRRKEDLIAERDRLIREAVDQGIPERQIAVAAGLSHGRVNQIVHRR